MRILVRLFIMFTCLLAAAGAHADERILDFHSEIAVAADAGMRVTETIRVRAEGQQIRHGIYRDFPTDYRDRYGNRVRVAFKPLALTRDGAAEPFHSERIANGVRVYFGAADKFLPAGEYVYTFTYHTDRQLGFFSDHDELYWNVTGSGWDFAIDSASASVQLPGAIAADMLTLEAYTGRQGMRDKDYRASQDGPSRALFATTQPLQPREGLTIVVGFPKGHVVEPGERQRVLWFVRDHVDTLALVAGLLLILTYYLVQWSRVGRDPLPGTIIAQYEPPANYTPGALRYVLRMGWDARCVAADLVDAAVHGAIHIAEDEGRYRIGRKDSVTLPSIEAGLVNNLLGADQSFVFKTSEHERISTVLDKHKKALKSAYGKYFNANTGLVVIGALLTVATLFGAILLMGEGERITITMFIIVWLSGWSLGVFLLCRRVVAAWRESGRDSLITRAMTKASAIFLTVFALPFVIGEFIGLGVLLYAAGVAFAIAILALLATNLLFFHLMKAPTPAGRKLLDQIEGLRLYLGVAERDELARAKAPTLDIDEFQRMLPWALALGVEKNWTDQFAAAVGHAAATQAMTTVGWYRGAPVSNLDSFASGLGASFDSAISSSSTAPGSSSGGGGGGSSGGGGGGGGGGGW